MNGVTRSVRRSRLSRSPAEPWSVAGLVVLAGACAALGLANWTARSNAAFVANRFRIDTDRLTAQIRDRITLYQYGLRGARGAVIAAGPDGITRESFRHYAESRDIATEFPGARGFGFIRRVREDAEPAFVAKARSDGAPDFAIKRLAPHAGDRYVIQYVEPVTQNRQAIGLDIASDPRRRDAARRAMVLGAPALTAPITLVQAAGMEKHGLLLMIPVERPGARAETGNAREAATIGWTYAALVVDEVLAEINRTTRDIAFAIADRTEANEQPFFVSADHSHARVEGFRETRPVPIFGRTWDIEARPLPEFVAKFGLIAPRTVGLITLVVSLLLSIVTFMFLSSRQRERLAAIERNRLAAIVEGSNDAIIGKTLDGVVVAWNRAAEQLFGYAAAEAIGRRISALIIPPELHSEEGEVMARLKQGDTVPPFTTERRRRDGCLLPMVVSMSPIRASDHSIVGVATIARDVSEQRAAEAHVRELNADLERQVAERTAELAQTLVLQSTILKNAAYAVIATDAEGTITLFNPAAERLLGYAASDLVGRCSPAVFHEPNEVKEQAGRLSKELGTIIEPGFEVFVSRTRRGLPNADEWTYVKKNGDPLPVLLNISALQSDDGRTIGFIGIAIDLTERYRHEDEMRAANAGTWSYDVATGRVKLSAEAARQHGLGDAATEIDVETQWRSIAHPDDVPLVLGHLQAAIATNGRYTIEFRLRLPDSSVRWITAMGRAETDEHGHVGRVIGLTLDSTARKEAEHALIEAKAEAERARSEAERANAAKTDFLAAMSHEIRTPLNAIIGFTDLMIDSRRLNGDLRRYAELVRSSGSALLTVVNDILDFSRVEAGAIELKEEPFSPRALLDNALSIVRTIAVAKGLDVKLECDPTIPGLLFGDQTRLRQVLLNLLNNAIKFTPAGSIVLSAHRITATSAGTSLRLCVADTGIGIAKDQHHRLFQHFSQVDGSIQRDFGGTGLGLAISKRLVERMGGDIGVISDAGQGSSFWVTVTLPEASLAETQLPHAEDAGPPRRAQVLLVEDVDVNQELARIILEAMGHTVDVVSDGASAVAAVETGRYDVVLMDVQMPRMDGMTATKLIRRLPSPAARVPIIAMTANVLPHQVRSFREAGMDDHIGKPFKRAELAATLQKWLVDSGDPLELEAVTVVDDFDASAFADLASCIAAARLADILRSYASAVGEFAELPRGPAERSIVRRHAHSLCSHSGMLGFKRLSAACRSLESCTEDQVEVEGSGRFDGLVVEAQEAAVASRAWARRLIEDIDGRADAPTRPHPSPMRVAR